VHKKYDHGKFESVVNLKKIIAIIWRNVFCEIPVPTLSLSIEVYVVKISNLNLE